MSLVNDENVAVVAHRRIQSTISNPDLNRSQKANNYNGTIHQRKDSNNMYASRAKQRKLIEDSGVEIE